MKHNTSIIDETLLPELVIKGEIRGYELPRIELFMKQHNLLLQWRTWFRGKTSVVIGSMFVVFDYDVDKFINRYATT
jgi:hypothetical protein